MRQCEKNWVVDSSEMHLTIAEDSEQREDRREEQGIQCQNLTEEKIDAPYSHLELN